MRCSSDLFPFNHLDDPSFHRAVNGSLPSDFIHLTIDQLNNLQLSPFEYNPFDLLHLEDVDTDSQLIFYGLKNYYNCKYCSKDHCS